MEKISTSPKLTVVTAIRDGFEYFPQAARSVLEQTFSDFEWFIYDDASTQPLSQCCAWLLSDPRVHVTRGEDGRGQTYGLNEGIRRANSPWIVRVDGDDICCPTRLEKTINVIHQDPGVRLIFSDYEVIDERGELISQVRFRSPFSKGFFHYLMNQNNPICHPTVTFFKYRSNGTLNLFPESLKNAQDYALWKQIISEYSPDKCRVIGEITLQYRVVSTSLSGARAFEQRSELESIRSGKEIVAVQTASMLNDRQKQVMQAFRLLYYRFIGVGAFQNFVKELFLVARNGWIMPEITAKTFLLVLLSPFRFFLKRRLFGGSYL